jgi:hypothetical protein
VVGMVLVGRARASCPWAVVKVVVLVCVCVCVCLCLCVACRVRTNDCAALRGPGSRNDDDAHDRRTCIAVLDILPGCDCQAMRCTLFEPAGQGTLCLPALPLTRLQAPDDAAGPRCVLHDLQ